MSQFHYQMPIEKHRSRLLELFTMIVLHRICLFISFSLIVPLSLFLVGNINADIRLPKIFGDQMVLQHGGKINIWGTAESGEELTITLGDQSAKAKADCDGKWATKIDSPEKAGGPYTLTVKGAESSVVFNDVLLGEVWLCSGQSNMEWSVQASLNPDVEAELADYPNIRLFTVNNIAVTEPLSDCNSVVPWRPCNEKNIRSFSAVAYYYGRHLHKKLNKPIGLIDSTWGGTRCEAWTSRGALEQVDVLKPLLEHWDANTDKPRSPHRPSNLYNGMIAPLAPFNIKGAIWYQGESNVGRGHQYATLFPTMISDWRNAFQQPDLPFVFVQLAPFRYNGRDESALPEVWDAQLKTLGKLKNTGMAVTTDIGNLTDIHPRNKQSVGRRLALWSLANCYGVEGIHYSAPQYASHSIENGKIRIKFKFAEQGLMVKGRGKEPSDFQICGADKQFKPAKAVIEGNEIVVSSDEVETPVAVRFGWTNTATPNLFGRASNLPVSPFRTDFFDLLSKERSF